MFEICMLQGFTIDSCTASRVLHDGANMACSAGIIHSIYSLSHVGAAYKDTVVPCIMFECIIGVVFSCCALGEH